DSRDGPGAVRVRGFGGERDGTAARPAVSRRTRRPRPLARDLARPGVPRLVDGHPCPQRTTGDPGAVHAVPRVAPAPASVDLALRPDRRGCARRARPPPRATRERDRGVLLRARERGRPPCLLPARAALAPPRRTPQRAPAP